MANPPSDLMSPPSDLVDSPATDTPPSDLMAAPEDMGKKPISMKSILERGTALPRAFIGGLGKVTGQQISMEPTEPVRMAPGERAKELGASTLAGGAAGYLLPKALQAFPVTRPIGMAMEMVPPSQRIVGGAAGAGLADISKQTAEAYGAPTAVKLPLEVLSAGLGDVVGQRLTNSFTNLLKAGYYGLKGSPYALSYAKSILGQSPEEKAKQAVVRQQQIFGKPTEAIPGEIGDKFQTEAQTLLKDKYGFGKETPIYEPRTGREVMVPGTDLRVPAKGVKPVQLEPTGETVTRELKPGQKVSEALREDLYKSVNETTLKMRPEDRFSRSPEFQAFVKKLQPLVEIGPEGGGISQGDFNSLFRAVASDQGSLAARKQFAQTLDNVIRNWQGKIGAEGRAAIPEATARRIREDLRQSFSGWAQRNNLGNPERAYREAFTTEKAAEAKDKIPYIISQYGTKPEADRMAMQISKDPQLKPALDQAIRQNLANTPVEELTTEFKRVDKLLVRSGLADAKQMFEYRKLVKEIEDIRQKGGNATPFLLRLRNQLIRSGALTGVAEASGAVSE